MPITQINTNQYISVATSFGDVKHGFQSSDHNGWIKLDGRLISTLSANQQTQATALGFTVNLPDATDKYLSQVTAGALGTVSGNTGNQITLAQNQLPNINYTGRINLGEQTAPAGASGVFALSSWVDPGVSSGVFFSNTADKRSFTFSLNLNGGVAQQVTNIKPETLKANAFVYLGL